MPFIDATYFDGDLLLVGVNHAPIAEAITMAIEQCEPVYLDKVLGVGLAEAFADGLAHPVGGSFSTAFSSAFNTGGIAPRWTWLRDGKVFRLPDGSCIRWQGLRNARKRSPLANYTYDQYRRSIITQTASTGEETQSKGENSSNTAADIKMVRAWNQMVEWNLELHTVLSFARDANGLLLYPEYREQEVDLDLFTRQNTFGI